MEAHSFVNFLTYMIGIPAVDQVNEINVWITIHLMIAKMVKSA